MGLFEWHLVFIAKMKAINKINHLKKKDALFYLAPALMLSSFKLGLKICGFTKFYFQYSYLHYQTQIGKVNEGRNHSSFVILYNF